MIAPLLLGLAACLAPLSPNQDADYSPARPRPGASGVGDRYYPYAGNGGYDVQHYDVSLAVEMKEGTIQAEAAVTALATHALSSFNLDLVGLRVEAIQVDGKPAEFERESRELVITPAEPIEEGAEFTAVVKYSGRPWPAPDPAVESLGFSGVGWFKMDSGIYVISECTGTAGWLPCNDHPSDKATFSFRVRVPRPYVVAANGLLIEELDHGDSRTFVWMASDPMATYLATINIAVFEVRVEEGPDGLPLRLYYPNDATEHELSAFARTEDMLRFFSEKFGPYPFEAYGGVLSYEFLGGALETQTIPVYSRRTGEDTVAHEMAHMWFGNCVSPAEWKHMWLNEGFAVYAEWLWQEHDRGKSAMETAVKRAWRISRRAGISPPADPGVRRLFGGPVYIRGPLVLHALREKVGDEAFFKTLQTWFKENFNGNATTKDFISLCVRLHGEEIEELLEDWIYAKTVPVVEEYQSQGGR